MFRSHRLYKSHIAARSRQDCKLFDQGNLQRCITPRLHPSNHVFRTVLNQAPSRLAVSLPPLREVLFEQRPSCDNKDPQKLKTVAHKYSYDDNMAELLFILNREYPVNSSKGEQYHTIIPPHVLRALKRCYLKSPNNVSKLHLTNAIVGRFQKLGISMPLALLYYGLEAAAWGNHPAAMKQYFTVFDLAKQTVDFPRQIDLNLWKQIFQAILVATRTTLCPGSEIWRRKRAQWIEVVTGWNVEDARFVGRERCIYDILLNFGVRGLAIYFRLVRQLCPTDMILRMWLEHHLLDKFRDLPPDTLNFIFNSFIQLLLAKKDPMRAWKVAQNTAPRFGAIQDRSWQLLLRHPEFLDDWIPGMDKSVFDALEKYASYVERQLGVEWTGGEDGTHFVRIRKGEQ